MPKNPIPCGGFDYDANTLRFIERDGRPTLEVIGGITVGEGEIDMTQYLRIEGGTMQGNLNMNDYAITRAQKFSTNGAAPVFIGSTIEQEGTLGARITGVVGGEGLAIVQPDTVDTYAPIAVADPADADHAATKRYVDETYDEKFATSINDYLNSVEGQALIRSIVEAM